MSTIVSPVDAARIWLERIMISKVVGFSVLDESGTLVQCIDDDPDLREALMEYQAQRVRQLERSQRTAQPAPERDVLHILTGDQIGDEPALADGDEQALTDLAWQINNAGADRSNTPTFPGS
jgi:hypothetical protein